VNQGDKTGIPPRALFMCPTQMNHPTTHDLHLKERKAGSLRDLQESQRCREKHNMLRSQLEGEWALPHQSFLNLEIFHEIK
jgi:hypothetical protein